MSPLPDLLAHRADVLGCRRCPAVVPPSVCGPPVPARIYLLGQAPGVHEPRLGRPFAWTAGRTLFRWFAEIGAPEAQFREQVYMAAVLRCFPGRPASGRGDRIPHPTEIARCRPWIERELDLLRPALVLAVGRLAIAQVAGRAPRTLEEVVGPIHPGGFGRPGVDWVALPHPSGVSAWPKMEPGRTLLARALGSLGAHPAWRASFPGHSAST